MLKVYVAGPYSAPTPGQVERNITRAREISAQLWAAGHAAFCPHMNTAFFDRRKWADGEPDWLEGDLQWLRHADALVMVHPDADTVSRGTARGVAFCDQHEIPVFPGVDEFLEWAAG